MVGVAVFIHTAGDIFIGDSKYRVLHAELVEAEGKEFNSKIENISKLVCDNTGLSDREVGIRVLGIDPNYVQELKSFDETQLALFVDQMTFQVRFSFIVSSKKINILKNLIDNNNKDIIIMNSGICPLPVKNFNSLAEAKECAINYCTLVVQNAYDSVLDVFGSLKCDTAININPNDIEDYYKYCMSNKKEN